MLVLLILIFEQNSDLKKICMYVKFDQEVLNTSKINRNDKIFINKKKNIHVKTFTFIQMTLHIAKRYSAKR